MIENVRRKGREDGSFLPDRPQNGNGLFRKRNTNAIPSLLDGDTHVIASLLSFQVFPSKSQQISPPKTGCDIEANSLFHFFILERSMFDCFNLLAVQPLSFAGMVPFDTFNLLSRIEVYQVVCVSNPQKPLDILEITGGRVA